MLDNIREKETLPKGPEDEIIPTRIAAIEEHEKYLQKHIADLNAELSRAASEKDMLLKRAEELGISEDMEYRIVKVPVYPKKRVDVEWLKQNVPDAYDRIVGNILARIQEKAAADRERSAMFIAQADVKAVIRDKSTLAMAIPEPKEPDGFVISIVRK